MQAKHTLWLAALHGSDSQPRISKRTVPLPLGIALNPDCQLSQPLPAYPPAQINTEPLLTVSRSAPETMLERLYLVFKRTALQPTENEQTPIGPILTAFERWLAQYTDAPSFDTETLIEAIDHPIRRSYTHPHAKYCLEGAKLATNTWIFHVGQEVSADAR